MFRFWFDDNDVQKDGTINVPSSVMLEVIVTQVQDYERSYADFCNHFQS